MKRFKTLFLSLAGLALVSTFVWAAQTSIVSYKGEGALRAVDVYELDRAGDVNIYQGDIQLGQNGLTPSTTADTYPGMTVPVYNAYGASIPVGSVMIASTTSNILSGYGSIAAAASTTTVIGIAYETIASGAVGDMKISGYALVLTTGPVYPGDVLVSTNPLSGAVGYAGADASPTTGSDIGVAMSAGTAAGGLTLIRLR